MKNRRAIVLLLLANSVSGVAQGISMLAIPWYFTSVLQREELFGQMYFAVTLLSLFWGLYAGTLVDRYDRKKIFLYINLVGGAVMTGIALTGYIQGGLAWPLVMLSFTNTMFAYNIHFPNLYAYAQEITTPDEYHRVTSTIEIQGQLTFTLAGGLAAMLLQGIGHTATIGSYTFQLPFTIAPWGIHEIFALDAATYFVSYLLIRNIKTLSLTSRTTSESTVYERLKVGVAFLRKHPLLFHFGNTSLLLFLAILISGTYLMPIYVNKFLHADAAVYAAGDMAFSFGALLAGIISARLFAGKELKGIIWLNIVAALMYAAMTINRSVPLFYLGMFVIGSCNAAVRIQRVTFIFTHTPNHIIGRSGSIFFVINVLERLALISLFSLPFFHQNENIVFAVGTMSAVCLYAALYLTVRYRSLLELNTAQ